MNKELAPKHLLFCKAFVRTFDLNSACEFAKIKVNTIMPHLYDENSPIYQYITGRVDCYAVQNRFISEDVIKYKLNQIVLNGEDQHKIQAAKILLGLDGSVDNTAAFKHLINTLANTGE